MKRQNKGTNSLSLNNGYIKYQPLFLLLINNNLFTIHIQKRSNMCQNLSILISNYHSLQEGAVR